MLALDLIGQVASGKCGDTGVERLDPCRFASSNAPLRMIERALPVIAAEKAHVNSET